MVFIGSFNTGAGSSVFVDAFADLSRSKTFIGFWGNWPCSVQSMFLYKPPLNVFLCFGDDGVNVALEGLLGEDEECFSVLSEENKEGLCNIFCFNDFDFGSCCWEDVCVCVCLDG